MDGTSPPPLGSSRSCRCGLLLVLVQPCARRCGAAKAQSATAAGIPPTFSLVTSLHERGENRKLPNRPSPSCAAPTPSPRCQLLVTLRLTPQEEGKIRAIGVSNFGPADLAAAVATGARISTNQLPYSLAWRAIEHEVTLACTKADVGVMGYSPLAQGLLSGRYSATADVSPAISRSRLFHRDTSPRARHEEEGCEAELWSLVAELRSVSEEVSQVAVVIVACCHPIAGCCGCGCHCHCCLLLQLPLLLGRLLASRCIAVWHAGGPNRSGMGACPAQRHERGVWRIQARARGPQHSGRTRPSPSACAGKAVSRV